MNDLNQVREFISALSGSSSSPVTFQVFYDPKDGTTRPDLAATWTADIDSSLDYLQYAQSQYCGVYMTINETDGTGRETDNITKLRVMFADFDGIAEPQWSITPHLVQRRDATHGHAFWLIHADGVSFDEWSTLQKQIAMYHGTDEQVIDPARVVRLPGTIHYKDPQNPVSYAITSNYAGSGHRYTIDEIRNACALPADLDAKLNQWANARAGIDEGIGYERNAQEESRFTSWLVNAAHPAIEGSGTHELIRVANFGHDHGIPVDTTIELMWEHYNPRCLPPWGEHERSHFEAVVRRAYKYAVSAPGCKTAKAAFQATPLVEPQCGWDNQRAAFGHDDKPELVQFDPDTAGDISAFYEHRLDKQGAVIVGATLNGKSSHYQFARVFDGINFDGTDLIRSGKTFYAYNGKTWQVVEDEVIRSGIQRYFNVYEPTDSFTSGIFRVLCDHVNVHTAENGKYVTDPERDTSNLAVFENGIVDLSANEHAVMPHTHEYFTFNSLPFDFNPHAQCPKWIEFLQSIWGDDATLKRQLQQFMGYCLTNDASLQKFGIFMGKPRAGKGVITDIISEMVGMSNISSPSLAGLVKDSALHEMSTSAVTLIPDAHNVNIHIRDGVLSNLKAITGGDSLSYHEIYKGSRTTKFNTKIIMSTNNVPDFIDSSGALVARMLIFPFNRSFVGKENPRLRADLTAEIEGIIQWAILGLRDLRACNNVFVEAESGKAEKEEIREDMFPLSQYVSEMCDMEEGVFTLTQTLYDAYRMWATSNGNKTPMTQIAFNKSLRNSALPIHHDRITAGRGFNGITIKSGINVASNNVVPGNFGAVPQPNAS